MSARTILSPNWSLRAICIAALAFAVATAGPAMASDTGTAELSDTAELSETVDIDIDVELTSTESVETERHQVHPAGLTGASDFDRFEFAWNSNYSSLEAAMIASAPHRASMPAIPQDSGSGQRVVYSLGGQRVWMVAADGFLIDTYLVSGRDWMPNLGTFRVWGKARRTNGYDPDYTMNWMVRFAVGSHGGNIGFHDLPLYRGRPVQTLDDLGTANLSGGCVRQDNFHARMMFAWTEIGSSVVVVP
jgi:lipoprotein-anchoring transpeptidase ErfK/SrfK